MLAGIGFVAMLTGALAQAFLARVGAAEEQGEDQILRWLGENSDRLERLERSGGARVQAQEARR